MPSAIHLSDNRFRLNMQSSTQLLRRTLDGSRWVVCICDVYCCTVWLLLCRAGAGLRLCSHSNSPATSRSIPSLLYCLMFIRQAQTQSLQSTSLLSHSTHIYPPPNPNPNHVNSAQSLAPVPHPTSSLQFSRGIFSLDFLTSSV